MVHGSFFTQVMTPVLIQFVASSGDAGCSKRIFARFSVPRLSDSGYPRMARAIIKAGLDGKKTSLVHWGGCLGHSLRQRDGMDEFISEAGIELGIENAAQPFDNHHMSLGILKVWVISHPDVI
jgi:hypothetical protein